MSQPEERVEPVDEEGDVEVREGFVDEGFHQRRFVQQQGRLGRDRQRLHRLSEGLDLQPEGEGAACLEMHHGVDG